MDGVGNLTQQSYADCSWARDGLFRARSSIAVASWAALAISSSLESVFDWQLRSEDVHISSSSPCCIAFQFCLWSQIWNWWDRMSCHLAFLLFAAASISLASGLSWPQWPPAQVLFENDIAGKTIFCPSLWFHPIKDNEHTAQDRTLPGVELDPEADWNAALTKNVARLTLLTSQ